MDDHGVHASRARAPAPCSVVTRGRRSPASRRGTAARSSSTARGAPPARPAAARGGRISGPGPRARSSPRCALTAAVELRRERILVPALRSDRASSSSSSGSVRVTASATSAARSIAALARQRIGRRVASRRPAGVAVDDKRLGPLRSAARLAPRRVLGRRHDGDAVALGDCVTGSGGCAHEWRFATHSPHRVPDGLQLEEGGDLPRALRVGTAADDALDVVGREPLELGASPLGAGEVDRVHVHVRGEPRRELGAVAGEQVDDAAGHVAASRAPRRARSPRAGCVSDATATTAFPPTSAGASRETRPSSGGSSGASDRDDAGRLRHREVEVRAGDRVRAAEHLRRACPPSPAYQTMRSIERSTSSRPVQSSANSATRASIISASR